jgi:hydroxymethylglutaryl-CoA lyase
VGSSDRESIEKLFGALIPALPEVTFGAHLHTTPESWEEKVHAAYGAGCRRFDGALKGYGGCPMAKDDLTGNMPTEQMLSYFDKHGINTGIDTEALGVALRKSEKVFA